MHGFPAIMNFISLVALLGIILVILLTAFFLLLEIYFIVIGHIKGAPFVKSGKKKIAIMFELAKIQPGEKITDLGSGDGALLIEAARQGAHAFGAEINPFLVWYSRWRAKRTGLQQHITIARQDFFTYPLHDIDVAFCYLLPETVDALKEKFSRELKPDARIVSNAFPVKDWTPLATKEGVYLYKKP